MKAFIKWCIIICLVYLIAGCGGSDEPLYQGLPLKTWVKRLEAPETEIRVDALKVIADIGKPARPAKRYVRDVARNDPSTEVRLLAIEALEAMDVPAVEFQNFLDSYYAPIIPDSEEYFDDFERDVSDEDDLLEHASGDDDLAFLRAFEEDRLDSVTSRLSEPMPKDSAEFIRWFTNHQSEEVLNLTNQLNNPKMLAKLLEVGSVIEREFAARKLIEIVGDDPKIIEALEKASNDSIDTIRQAAEEALQKWLPEE